MSANPYAQFVGLARKMAAEPPLGSSESGTGAAARLYLGVVDTASPLCVKAAGLKLKARALKLSRSLAADAVRPGLEAGDRVLLLTCDGQTFYIVMKVVDAS